MFPMKTLLLFRALPAALLLLAAYALLPAARAAAPPARGVAVVGVEPVGRPNAGNAALFVGVNEFEDASLRALRFAVNDAVAQAHLFVLDLKLIPPANTVLLLSGEPSTAVTRTQLAALKEAGVRVERASRSKLFNELLRAVAVPQEAADLVIVSLSSHGFEENGVPYVLPADGTRGFLADTGFSLKTVEDRLGRSKAGKRLLIVDAWREKATGDDKSTGGAMDRAWRAALAQASGQAVLASCDVGQFSFEDVKLGHGVFTYHLLEALGGKAAADSRGFITLGSVSDHVARAVNEWVGRNKVGSVAESAQKPWFKGPNDARDMPLAISKTVAAQQQEAILRKQRALDLLTDTRKAQRQILTAEVEGQVEQALQTRTGEKLVELLEQIETLTPANPALVRGFVGWWKAEGMVLGGSVPPVSPLFGQLALTTGLSLEALAAAKAKAETIKCFNQLKQIGLACRVYASDNDDQYPWNVSTKKKGTMELAQRDKDGFDANPVIHFRVMQDELGSPKILACPSDTAKSAVDTFANLTQQNVSYWVRTTPEVDETNPNQVMVYCPIHRTVAHADGSVIQHKPDFEVTDLINPHAAASPTIATKDSPWVNTLGMKFVPVPGTPVLFGVWHVRVQDFEAFVKATGHDATTNMFSLKADGGKQRGDTWKSPGFAQGPTHPVCGVNWDDAQAFAKWLTEKERREGKLTAGQSYRLPQDWEWSVAVGLAEAREGTPKDKDGKIKDVYPWGTQWPPPVGAGNYAGEEAKDADWPATFKVIEGYRDGYARTSPVGSFAANKFGLHDLGGNLWQWCEDWYDESTKKSRVLRGGSWNGYTPLDLLSSYRGGNVPESRIDFNGFRLVVVVAGSFGLSS